MPLYGTEPVPALMRGIPHEVFGETLNDNDASIAVALVYRTGRAQNVTFEVFFPADPPVSVSYQPQVAMEDDNDRYYNLGSPITDITGGKITHPDINARFARMLALDSDVEPVTAQITQA